MPIVANPANPLKDAVFYGSAMFTPVWLDPTLEVIVSTTVALAGTTQVSFDFDLQGSSEEEWFNGVIYSAKFIMSCRLQRWFMGFGQRRD